MADDSPGGIHALFNHPGVRRVLVKLRVPLTLAVAALMLRFVEPRWFWLALGVSAFGELWQVWCFASLKKQKVLATRGPYVLMRNPMYLARYFFILGCLVLLGNPWVLAGYTVLYYFYIVNRVRREEKKLIGIFGPSYEQYCRDVNRFLPTLRNRPWRDVAYFQWSLLIGNHGGWNALGSALFYVAVYLYLFVWTG